MSDFFAPFVREAGFGTTTLPTRFDAERDTPELIDVLTSQMPQVRTIMASLRRSVPLAPTCAPGPFGRFYRIPNHYRSISFLIPPLRGDGTTSLDGVVVFKGSEPLLPDFPRYLDWMVGAPFRASALPMALHFALEVKLPPAAMWIEECMLEQHTTSRIQSEYLGHYGHLARMPVPLFVFELTRAQVDRYVAAVRSRMSAAAFARFDAKVSGGLGIEVYYYPSLPIRVADLFVPDVRNAFQGALGIEALERMFGDWIKLLYQILHLGYMPYAPWNHGMGACVDTGNACIDGGVNDLLTLVPFDSIPSEHFFRRSLQASIEHLGASIAATCAVASQTSAESKIDHASGTHVAYIVERLRTQVHAELCKCHTVDRRLTRFFDVPTVSDVIEHIREVQGSLAGRQFSAPSRMTATPGEQIAIV